MTEEEMVGQHYRLNRHEFEQTLGDSRVAKSWTLLSDYTAIGTTPSSPISLHLASCIGKIGSDFWKETPLFLLLPAFQLGVTGMQEVVLPGAPRRGAAA